MHLSTPKSFGQTLALLCAASAHFLACTGAPVRPDPLGFLERCPPEALMTAVELGFGEKKKPFTDVELWTGIDVSAPPVDNILNFRNGPVEGWLILPDEKIHWATGEARVFEGRIYMQFDRIYLDELHPNRGRVASPLCAVAVSLRGPMKLGIYNFEVGMPVIDKYIDPAKVVYRGPDAAIIPTRMVDIYVQLPGRRFPK